MKKLVPFLIVLCAVELAVAVGLSMWIVNTCKGLL